MTGCWNYRELNDISYVTALGISKSDEGYEVSAQIVNPSELIAQDNYGYAQIVTYKAEGKSVFEALRNFTKKQPSKLYLAHTQILVLSEELAREGISKVMDMFNRDHEFFNSFYIMVSRGVKPNELLGIFPPLCKVPSSAIIKSLKSTGRFRAYTRGIQASEFNHRYLSKGINPIVTGIYAEKDLKEAKDQENLEKTEFPAEIVLDSIGILKDDKLIGWLTDKNVLGYNLVMGDNINPIILLENQNNNITIELIRVNRSISGRVVNNKPIIDINLKADASIGELSNFLDLRSKENLRNMEQQLNNEIKGIVMNSIKVVQKDYGSDIFGFGETIYRSNLQEWKHLRDNWDEVFKTAEVNVSVESSIKTTGRISNPLIK